MRQLFNKYKHLLGMSLLCFGVIMMIVAYIFGWTSNNWVTLPLLLVIIAGAVCHVAIMKHESKY